MTISEGGYQPDSGMKLPATVRVIKEIEPGLHLVSINEGAPEYLISADRVRGGVLESIRAVLEEVPRSELDPSVRGVPAPDAAPPI